MTKLVQEYDPSIILERHSASELVYGIKRGASAGICRLINGLDERGEMIGIKGFGLSATTIEEVFLK